MSVHILGICGTFMAGVAQLARESGLPVQGSDAQTYPPMSTLLEGLGIEVLDGYQAENLRSAPSEVVVGNALSRGNPEVEAVLNSGLPIFSGPQWLRHRILQGRTVLAVAGTHGKTTTSSLLTWILTSSGQEPGFLIGGLAPDLGQSARLGRGPFVIEADEYDSAFFDKRSKFVHYFPNTLIFNNLEFDHADIFPDLGAIKTQFHHLVRTVAGSGCIVVNRADRNLADVLSRGCWSRQAGFALEGEAPAQWQARTLSAGGGFLVLREGKACGEVHWRLSGAHNTANGLAAIAASAEHGVSVGNACDALSEFAGVSRRMERVGERGGAPVFDDFAHHPTAISATIAGARERFPDRRVVVALEPRSNSMRAGVHAEQLAGSLADADRVWVYAEQLEWDPSKVLEPLGERVRVISGIDNLLDAMARTTESSDCVIFMSNGAFGNAPRRFVRWPAAGSAEATSRADHGEA